MDHRFPLELMVKNTAERFQLAFARNALKLIGDCEDLQPEVSHKGLMMLGENEASLDAAVDILVSEYGDDLEIGRPQIRYIQASSLQEPFMTLQIEVPFQYAGVVRQDLKARGADILEMNIWSGVCAIQAQAPLTELLGYAKALDHLSGGTGQQQMKLSHYAPLGPDPGGHAA